MHGGGTRAARRSSRCSTAVFPLRHRPRVIARQQATPHEEAQQAPAHLRLDFGDGGGFEPGDVMEDDPPAAAASNTPSMTTNGSGGAG